MSSKVRTSVRSGSHQAARHATAILATAAAALVVALSVATPALAHNYYVESTPAVNETLTTLPGEFVVTTNDNLLNLEGTGGGFFLKVTGPNGLYYGDGCVTVNGASASMPAALGPAGDYTLDWQVVSADGHTVSDVIPFSWQPAAGEESTTQGSTTMPNCGADGVVAPNGPKGNATDEVTTDVLWIGGGVLAVALAIVATLLLLRPKKKDDTQDLPESSSNQAPEAETPEAEAPEAEAPKE